MGKRAEIIADLKANPERHRHTFDQLRVCCFDGGALDVDLMQRHEGLGLNGARCDVVAGWCACGTTHPPESVVEQIAEIEVKP